MQHRVVREQLNVSLFEIHVEVQAGCEGDLFVGIEEFTLEIRKSSGIIVALNRAKVVAVIERAQAPRCVSTRRNRKEAKVVAGFGIPHIEQHRLEETLREVWTLRDQLVEDADGADDSTQSATASLLLAQ